MGGSPKTPKAQPAPAPPPTETSMDVQQEKTAERRRAKARGGKSSTFLTEQTNPAEGSTVLG